MRQTLHIRVAIHAGEQAAVNRLLELGRVHVQADRLAINLLRQSGIGVAGEAVAVLELMLGMERAGPGKKRQGQRMGDDPSSRVHALEETLRRKRPQ